MKCPVDLKIFRIARAKRLKLSCFDTRTARKFVDGREIPVDFCQFAVPRIRASSSSMIIAGIFDDSIIRLQRRRANRCENTSVWASH